MVFERGCAAAGRYGQEGNKEGIWCWRGDVRRRIFWCFLAAMVLAGMFFGYNQAFRPGSAAKEEVGEKSSKDEEGSRLGGHHDAEVRYFENISGLERRVSGCPSLRNGTLAERGRRKDVCKSVGGGEVPVLMEDRVRGDETSRVLGICAHCGRTPLVEAIGLGPWEEERRWRDPLRASMKVEDFLLKKYRCQECRHQHQAVVWPVGCVAGAVGKRPDRGKAGSWE